MHGVLHLCGYDHEVDWGEMLELQAAAISTLKPPHGGDCTISRCRLHRHRRAPERGQVHARQRDRRYEGGDRLRSSPDHATCDPGDRDRSAEDWQMVLVDLPGVQRPRDSLTERMQRRVELKLSHADAALLVTDGVQGVGPGDRFVAKALLGARGETPVICAVNSVDRLGPPATVAALAAAAELKAVDEVFPLSAKTGTRPRGADRPPRCPAAGRPAALPARGPLRPAQRGAPRRADPRAGASANPPRGPACGRGDRLRSQRREEPASRSRSSPRSGSRPSHRRASWWERGGGWCVRSAPPPVTSWSGTSGDGSSWISGSGSRALASPRRWPARPNRDLGGITSPGASPE